jgi:steroid delta-isomerase
LEDSKNREAILKYYQYVDANDVGSLVALFDERAVYQRPGYDPIIGKGALNSFYRGERLIESGRHELRTLVDGGEQVAVEGRFVGRLKDGNEVDVGFADFFSLQEGRIAKRTTYFDRPAV